MNMSVRDAVYWACFMAGVIAAYFVMGVIGGAIPLLQNQIVRIIGLIGAGVCCGLAGETVYKSLKGGGKR